MTHDSLLRRLRAHGWRLTRQRQAVVTFLDETQGHFSAEEVHAAVQTSATPISLATVYNTLTALAAMGELCEVRAGRGPTRFDPNVRPHDHLVCGRCGHLIDIEPVLAGEIELPAARRHGFAVDGVDVIVRGRCRDCAARK